jgi:hypothetical protein
MGHCSCEAGSVVFLHLSLLNIVFWCRFARSQEVMERNCRMQVWGIVLILLGMAVFQLRILRLTTPGSLKANRPEEPEKWYGSRSVDPARTVELLEGSHLHDVVAGLCSVLGLILLLWD